MDRYAHEDQVSCALAAARASLFGLLDLPSIPEELFNAVMEELTKVSERIVWSAEEEIALDYWDSINDE